MTVKEWLALTNCLGGGSSRRIGCAEKAGSDRGGRVRQGTGNRRSALRAGIVWLLIGSILVLGLGLPGVRGRTPSLSLAAPLQRVAELLPEGTDLSEEGIGDIEGEWPELAQPPWLRPATPATARRYPPSGAVLPLSRQRRPSSRIRDAGHFLNAGRALRFWLQSQTC